MTTIGDEHVQESNPQQPITIGERSDITTTGVCGGLSRQTSGCNEMFSILVGFI